MSICRARAKQRASSCLILMAGHLAVAAPPSTETVVLEALVAADVHRVPSMSLDEYQGYVSRHPDMLGPGLGAISSASAYGFNLDWPGCERNHSWTVKVSDTTVTVGVDISHSGTVEPGEWIALERGDSGEWWAPSNALPDGLSMGVRLESNGGQSLLAGTTQTRAGRTLHGRRLMVRAVAGRWEGGELAIDTNGDDDLVFGSFSPEVWQLSDGRALVNLGDGHAYDAVLAEHAVTLALAARPILDRIVLSPGSDVPAEWKEAELVVFTNPGCDFSRRLVKQLDGRKFTEVFDGDASSWATWTKGRDLSQVVPVVGPQAQLLTSRYGVRGSPVVVVVDAQSHRVKEVVVGLKPTLKALGLTPPAPPDSTR